MALAVPVPRLSTPTVSSRKLLRWMPTCAGVLRATSKASWSITFWEMRVPAMGEKPKPLLTLIPVGPGVAVSKRSAPLPDIWLATIMLSAKMSPGAWLWKATPGMPLLMSVLWMTTLPEMSPGPEPSAKRPTPAPAPGT